MVKNQGLPPARLPHKAVVHLLQVGLLGASHPVKDILVPPQDLIVVGPLQIQAILTDQVVHLQDPQGLVGHHTVVDLRLMEDQMALVLMVLLLTEQWVATLVREDLQCLEVQGVLLPAPLVGHRHLVPQVLHQDQA